MNDLSSTLWDYVIIGAGSAGCVLAERLSADPATRVLLIEAGPPDASPYFSIPKGFAKTLSNPNYAWHYKTQPVPGGRTEVWPRGKVLGGSSAVNGMMYLRGLPEDYDGWANTGLNGWGWTEMRRAFEAVEAVQGEASGGPLDISLRPRENDSVCEALIAAGTQAGLARTRNLSAATAAEIGYLPATIRDGKRRSAAHAFLKPARNRQNLRLETGLMATRLLLEGRQTRGVEVRHADGSVEAVFAAETILSAGGLESPKLLQLSGIGAASRLQALGIVPVHNLPGVGQNMLEHRLLGFQFRIRRGGYNRWLRGPGLAVSMVRYLALRIGPLATGAYNVGALIDTGVTPGQVPDAELLMGPYSVDPKASTMAMERDPGLRIISFPLRPRSRGSLSISGPDPAMPLNITPNYLSDPYDRAVSIASAHYIRRLAAMPALAGLITAELSPGAAMQSDEEIVAAYLEQGVAGMHASSTCRMGVDENAVVAPDLRVHGIARLSVMDCSVLPSMVSGNTNGPVIAMAWRAAELIKARG